MYKVYYGTSEFTVIGVESVADNGCWIVFKDAFGEVLATFKSGLVTGWGKAKAVSYQL